MTIIGMLLLSSFMITPAVADGTGIIISDEKPEDGATDVSILLSDLIFDLNESQGNPMDYTVETNPDIGNGIGTGVYNDTYSVSVIGPLDWNTVYTWYVNVTNGTAWNNETFAFTTISQPDIVYVDDDYSSSTPDYGIYNFSKIQDGIDAVSEDGTVYVFNGTYYENVIVNKSVNLIGEDKDITMVDGSGGSYALRIINISEVSVSGFTIKNADYGIEIINSSGDTIADNIIRENGIGLEIGLSSNSIITDNNVTDNLAIGIELITSSTNNIVTKNNIVNNGVDPFIGYGLVISDLSDNNTIYHNNFIDNRHSVTDECNNTYDDGYEGNYWSDFDEPSEGAYDNNTDKIVDKPYNVSGGDSQDRYPLIFPYGEIPPVADFTYTVDEITVKFTSSSYDRDGTIASYYWEFGDGENSTEANPEHEYDEDYKTYTVNLTVTDDDRNTATVSKEVTTNDTTKPTIEIVKPKRALYIRNKKIRPLLFRMALIIGDITIEVNASDEGSGIEKVEFYAGLLGTKYLGNDTTEPYSFNWTRDRIRFFHIQILTVKAYDKAGNVAVKRMIVRKLL